MTTRPPAGDTDIEREFRSWQENPPRRRYQAIARQEQERLNRERRRISRPWWRCGVARVAGWAFWLLAVGVVAYYLADWLTAGAVPAGGMP